MRGVAWRAAAPCRVWLDADFLTSSLPADSIRPAWKRIKLTTKVVTITCPHPKTIRPASTTRDQCVSTKPWVTQVITPPPTSHMVSVTEGIRTMASPRKE